jgi:predicted RNase H-like HicB family nuclease
MGRWSNLKSLVSPPPPLCAILALVQKRPLLEAHMTFTVEYEQEEDGRWLAEVVEIPGALSYGNSAKEAIGRAQALALRVLADRLEHGEIPPDELAIKLAAHSV